MKRPFIICLLFYLLGAAISPALAETGMGIERSLLLALAEDVSESGPNLNEWLQKLPDFASKDHTFGLGSINFRSAGCLSLSPITTQQTTTSNKVDHRPFYLLFHALIFYESII